MRITHNIKRIKHGPFPDGPFVLVCLDCGHWSEDMDQKSPEHINKYHCKHSQIISKTHQWELNLRLWTNFYNCKVCGTTVRVIPGYPIPGFVSCKQHLMEQALS